MPYKKPFKKGKNSRRQKQYPYKKVYKVSKANRMYSGPNYGIVADPFPRTLRTRLKYINEFAIAGDPVLANTIGPEVSYRLTSIWDPLIAVGGTTVVGHAVMATLYQRYIVYGARVEIVFTDPSADGMSAYASLNQTVALTALTPQFALEDSLTWSSRLNNTGSQTRKMSFYVRPWSLKGLSRLEYMANKTERSSAISNNPSEDIVLRVAVSNGNAAAQTMRCQVKIVYYTELYDRRQLIST